MFQSLTMTLEGELSTLGYPRAALLGFGVALAAHNVLSTVQAALRASFGAEKVQEEVSAYYIANEVRGSYIGMKLALDDENVWEVFQQTTPEQLARELLTYAANVKLATLRRHPRGPKKPVPKRTRYTTETHVSTARLLRNAGKKKGP